MSELERTAHDLFREARGKTGDLQAYLKQVCGDNAELRQRVQALLDADKENLLPADDAHDATVGSKVQADIDATATHSTNEPGRGQQVGPYKVLEKIGEGGMGTVWVAQQASPIKRKVAVKLIKAGMDSQQVLARFEAERQALAMMDHPNIARVLDGGISEDGRPYFAMEYVRGVPLTDYCNKARLTVNERLELFQSICNAVQHAHQKGIIHRDLKPSNILVCLFDGKPVAKVIDFGLAKAMHHSLTEQTLHTAHGMMIGTPLYMSPEQAEQNNLDIDTRTDVYSLGVILYELLTGSTPLERAQMKKAAVDEILRLIKDVDPPKPSTRLGSSDDLPSVAAQRSIEPARLTRAITGDLDWVVMKALEKERGRRYETASALAEDVRRHLADEPVSAGPPSARYRLRKFVRRNRLGVIATGAIAVTMLLGVMGTTAGLFWALSQKELAEKARRAESEAKADAIDNANFAQRERKRAEENFDAARQAVEQYLVKVTDNEKLKESDFSELRKELLQSAAPFFERLRDQNPGDESVESSRADALFRLADLQTKTGELANARVNFLQAISTYLRLESEHPDQPEHRLERGRCHFEFGALLYHESDFDSARSQWEESRSILQNLADSNPELADARSILASSISGLAMIHESVRDGLGMEADAEEYRSSRELLRQAEDLQAGLAKEYPDNNDYQISLAATYVNFANTSAKLGDLEGAIQGLKNALVVFERMPTKNSSSPVVCHNNLAFYLTQNGQREAANAQLQLARAKAERLVEEFPSVVEHQVQLGIAYYRQGNVAAFDDHRAAVDWYDKASDVLRSVLDLHPNHAEAGPRSLNTAWNRAESLFAQGKFEEAAQAFRQYADRRRETNANQAAWGESRVADCWNSLGNEFAAKSDHDRARLEYLKAIEIQDRLTAESTDNLEFRAKLARSHYNLANTLGGIGSPPGLGDEESAELHYRIAVEVLADVVERDSSVAWYGLELADARENLSALLVKMNLPDKARAQSEHALELTKALVTRFPDVAEYRSTLGSRLHRRNEYDAAIAAYEAAIELDATVPLTHLRLGLVYSDQGRFENAIAAYERSLSIAPNYAHAHNNLGWAYLNMGRIDEAINAIRRALEIDADYPRAKWNLALAEAVKDASHTLASNPEFASAEQRVSVARYCVLPGRQLYLTAAQQLKFAFAKEPELAEPNESTHRYNAACYALRAIDGRGKDASDLTSQQIDKWRQQVLSWLLAELDIHTSRIKSKDPQLVKHSVKRLNHWLEDVDLEQVRNPMELKGISEQERQEWVTFWRRVHQVCDKASL